MLDRPHAVEQMRPTARTVFLGHHGLLVTSHSLLPDKHGDVECDCPVDNVQRTGQLQCNRNHPHVSTRRVYKNNR